MGDYSNLEITAAELRLDILDEIYLAESGHVGGSFYCVEILTALYFGDVLKYSSKEPDWSYRDKFVLSKGHAAPALYAVLSKTGYFEKEFLCTLRTIDSMLQGHPNPKVPGVECVTGSLGQGLSIAKGIALADKIDSRVDNKTYVLLGDGELQEGQIYEARRNIAHLGLSNIVAILDNNGLQLDGKVDDISKLGKIKNDWEAAGWHVMGEEISWNERLRNTRTYGHDFKFILNSLNEARKSKSAELIIASTVKGRGVSFMENNYKYHGKKIEENEYRTAHKELNKKLMELKGLKWPTK